MQYKHNAPVVMIHNKKEKQISSSEREFVKKKSQISIWKFFSAVDRKESNNDGDNNSNSCNSGLCKPNQRDHFFSTSNLAKTFTLNLMVRHPNMMPEKSVLLGALTSQISSQLQLKTLLHHPVHGRNRVTIEQSFSQWLDQLTRLFEDFREMSHTQCNPLQTFSFYQFTCPCLQALHSAFSLVL